MESHNLCTQTIHQQHPLPEPTAPHDDKEEDSPKCPDNYAHTVDDISYTTSNTAIDDNQTDSTSELTTLRSDHAHPPEPSGTSMASLGPDSEQDTTGDQTEQRSDSDTSTTERHSIDGDDDIVENMGETKSLEQNEHDNTDGTCYVGTSNDVDSAMDCIDGDGERNDKNDGQPTTDRLTYDDTVEDRRHNVTSDVDNERHPILDQSVDVVATANIYDRLDTTPTIPNDPYLSTTESLSSGHDDRQNDTQHSAAYLNDTTNPLLQTSTSATTTTTTDTATTTDTHTDVYYYMDQNPGTDYLADDNGYPNQLQPEDTPLQAPEQDNNNNILPSASDTLTPSYQTNVDEQPLNRTATVGSDEQTLSEPAGPRHEWESDRQASECRRCGRRFNFLTRRHHCRRCGQIVCDRCSSHRVRLPVEEIVEDPLISTSHYPIIALNPQRVCEACIRVPIKADSVSNTHSSSMLNNNNNGSNSTNGSSQRHHPINMQRSDSQQSLMVECPVCGNGLLGMRKEQQEYHLNQCLNTGSPTVRPPRYIIYTLMEGATQVGDECPICFEEFQVGNKIARMVCLCSYHRRCLREWLERGKGCPIHYDSNIGTY